jgi:hypothetical protein
MKLICARRWESTSRFRNSLRQIRDLPDPPAVNAGSGGPASVRCEQSARSLIRVYSIAARSSSNGTVAKLVAESLIA